MSGSGRRLGVGAVRCSRPLPSPETQVFFQRARRGQPGRRGPAHGGKQPPYPGGSGGGGGGSACRLLPGGTRSLRHGPCWGREGWCPTSQNGLESSQQKFGVWRTPGRQLHPLAAICSGFPGFLLQVVHREIFSSYLSICCLTHVISFLHTTKNSILNLQYQKDCEYLSFQIQLWASYFSFFVE